MHTLLGLGILLAVSFIGSVGAELYAGLKKERKAD